jgi:pyruvate dehydrogenase E2 component (dihydrolipoamide acetyltransferase)
MLSSPHIYLTIPITMDALLSARRARSGDGTRKVSLNAYLMKLAAEALKKNPRVNASWNDDSILLRGAIDIGLAVALPDGLVTPLVKDCGSKGILAIGEELADLIARARGGALKPEEYMGAGFTISNLGAFGVEEFTAVINPPAAAILAVGAIRRVPIVEADGGSGGPMFERVVVRSVMRVTLSADHRVIDGAVAAEFLAGLRGLIEDPFQSIL